jgi:hypothetical protein
MAWSRPSRLVAPAAALPFVSLGLLLVGWALFADPNWLERHVLAQYCVRDAAQIAEFRVARGVGLFIGVGLFLLAIPVARSVRGKTPREVVFALLRLGLAVVAALVVSEFWLRSRSSPPAKPGPFATRSIPGTVTVDGVEYAYNAEDNRARSQDWEPDYAKETLIFVGESIALGQSVRFEETFADQVGQRLGIQTVNIAGWGAASDEQLLKLRDTLPHFANVVAIVTLFLPDLLIRNVIDRRLHLAFGSTGALEVAEPVTPWVDLRLQSIWNRLVPYHSEKAIALTRAVLLETAALARARGAESLFVVTNYDGPPCIAYDGRTPWAIRSIFEEARLPYIEVDVDPGWRLPNEPHPDARAHHKIADAVEQRLREAGVVARR